MIEKLISRLFTRRHFWRHATFGEVAEIYTSRALRMAALHLVGGFISIYLYKSGYGVASIALFWTVLQLFRALVTLPVAKLVSVIGSKKATFIANILYIPAMIGFAFLPSYGLWMLAPIIFFEALSLAMYSIAYNVGFSKVKSVEHGGKELAFMHVMEKIAGGLSPVIGGFLAMWFGPEVALIVSGVLFMIAAMPLFKTKEQVSLGKPLKISSLPWKLIRGHAHVHASLGFESFIISTVWSLYLAVAIIGLGSDNEVYAVVGILSSVVLFVSLISSIVYGRLVDGNKGRELMKISSVFLSISHLFRITTNTPVGAAFLNAGTEAAYTGAVLPYVRALFDNADRSGNRVAYLGIMELLTSLGAAAAAGILLVASLVFSSDIDALKVTFLSSSAIALLIITARFPIYKK